MSETKTEIRKLSEGLSKHSEMLMAICHIEGKDKKEVRDEQVYRIVSRSSELVRGSSDLGVTYNAVSLGILARQVLEDLISLLWVLISEENAIEYSGAGINSLAKSMRINHELNNLRIMNSRSGERVPIESLDSDVLKKGKLRLKSIEARAREAGVKDLYNVFYRFMSIDTHGHSDVPKSLAEKIELSSTHVKGIGGLVMAEGHVATRWLLHRQRTDNETLRELLGLNQ